MNREPYYLFAGGGTGGHLTPGLAIAEELRQQSPAARIAFVGSNRTLENQFLADRGFERFALPVESTAVLRRNPLKFLWRNWRAWRIACELLDAAPPTAVIGLGGIISVPAVLAAARRKIPTVILEQNVVPGRATRFLSRRVNAVCTTFAETRAQLNPSAPVILTGNPVRRDIARLTEVPDRLEQAAQPTLLILGGSLGATAVNKAVLQAVERERPLFAGWKFVHQTGAAQVIEVRAAYARLGVSHVVEPFFNDMADQYRQSTLAVSRAGGTTLAELACCGCPAILIPYPHAADNHQLYNARAYAAAGAAVVVEQAAEPTATAADLAAALRDLDAPTPRRRALQTAMRRLAQPDATGHVIAALLRQRLVD